MWYLIDTGFKDPYYNMAYDESLMEEVKDRNTVFLRFFNFEPSSVSIGFHQKIEPWLLNLEKKGIKWVRRRTGGRAVIHSNDFTYSLVSHRDNPFIGGNIIESYKRIARAFMRTFDKMNVPTSIQRGKSDDIGTAKSHLCFSSTSIAELAWKGKKIIGSAQYRNREIVLQEGTVMLDEPEEIFPRVSKMATLKQGSGRDVTLKEIKINVVEGFKDSFNIDFKGYTGEPLRGRLLNKYSSKDWNKRGCS